MTPKPLPDNPAPNKCFHYFVYAKTEYVFNNNDGGTSMLDGSNAIGEWIVTVCQWCGKAEKTYIKKKLEVEL